MHWQLLDNEKHIQCSESVTTAANRDSSTASVTRTMSKSTEKENAVEHFP